MNEIHINNKNNYYQRFEVLKTNRNKRYKYNEFLVEGVRSLKEAVKNGWNIKSWIYNKNNLSDWAKETIHTVKTETNYCLTPQLLKELSGKENTSELMAVIECHNSCLDDIKLLSNPFIVLFDRPSNKGNLGTMIRSCDAMGADMLIITGHAVDLYEPDVVVSAMGSFFKLPVVRVTDNNELYGYEFNRDSNSLVAIKEEAEVVRLMFKLCIEGNGYRIISRKLTEMNVLNRKGKPFSASTIKNMLHNKKYCGFNVRGQW